MFAFYKEHPVVAQDQGSHAGSAPASKEGHSMTLCSLTKQGLGKSYFGNIQQESTVLLVLAFGLL